MLFACTLFLCLSIAHSKKQMRTEKVIRKLSEILLYEMGKEEFTVNEMAKKCGISRRKFCQIIYREKIGLTIEIYMKICENINIDYAEPFRFDD